VFTLPLLPANGFCPTWTRSRRTSAAGKLLVINYPTPDGRVADEGFYRKVIDFALKNRIVCGAGRRPHPADIRAQAAELPAGGRGDGGGVEVHSMSKGFDMIGWRMGFVAGHPLLVRAFADVKDNADSGQFMAIQKAAAAALADASIPVRIRASTSGGCASWWPRCARWVRGRDAGRHVLPVHAGPKGWRAARRSRRPGRL